MKSMPKNADAAQPGLVSREIAEHYRWGNDCDGWHLVKEFILRAGAKFATTITRPSSFSTFSLARP
jgi:hypothetical protein